MSTEIHEVLSQFAEGEPVTCAQVMRATGLARTRVNEYLSRLRRYGEIERIACGCDCVKHGITEKGLTRLKNPRSVGYQDKADSVDVPDFVEVLKTQPNSVFSLGAR